MKFLRTSTCCFCADLRTGGLLLGLTSLIFIMIEAFIAGLEPSRLWRCVVSLMFCGTWMYGILRQRTSWMLPTLTLNIFGLILEVMVLILLPIFGSIYAMHDGQIPKTLDDMAELYYSEASTILWVIWISFAYVTVIQYYISLVMYSLYKQMKEYGCNSSHMKA